MTRDPMNEDEFTEDLIPTITTTTSKQQQNNETEDNKNTDVWDMSGEFTHPSMLELAGEDYVPLVSVFTIYNFTMTQDININPPR